MPGRPLLLIEALDSLGAHVADARLRASLLRRAGWAPSTLVLPGASPAGPFLALGPRARAGQRVTRADELPGTPAGLAIIAASRATAAAIAATLPARFELRWWPTEVLDPAEPIESSGRRVELLFEPMSGALAGRRTRPARPALDCGLIASPPRRERDSLWDGDYVLSPGPLADPDGTVVLEAFARVAGEHDELDLVVLADPQPAFGDIARRLGVATRVHFAAPAARLAELIWLAAASAAIVGQAGPLSAAWVLRALARGCPVLPAGGGALASALRDWLAEGGCLVEGGISRRGDLAAALEVALAGGSAVTAATERGREVAAARTPGMIAARLLEAPPQAA